MKNFLIAALTVLVITGCNPCYDVECDSPDTSRINGLTFVFDTQNAYTAAEVDSAYIILFNKGDWDNPVASFSYMDDIKMSDDGSFMLQTGYPFSQVENFADWNFAIFPNVGETVYRIFDVSSSGYYPEDCCCCYRNVEKTFTLNNSQVERSGSEQAVVLNR